jgi:hypothetical protein
MFPPFYLFTAFHSTWWGSDRQRAEAGSLIAPGGGLIVCSHIAREPMPIALDRFSGRDLIGRSSPKGCSRSERAPRTSQTTAGMKREHNLGLEERIKAKEMKNKKQ